MKIYHSDHDLQIGFSFLIFMVDTSEYKSKLDYLQNKFNKLLDDLIEIDLDQQIHEGENGWTVIEILRHVAISEQEIVDLMHDIIEGSLGVSDDFDLDKVNERNRHRNKNLGLAEIRQIMERSRKNTLKFLENTTIEDWNKEGIYFTQDRMTISRMFEILMWHQNHHIKQILAKIR